MAKYFSKDKWSYMLYTLTHPMDGFYWIRHADRGSVPLAFLMVIAFSAAFTLRELAAAFVVNDIDPRGVDSLFELLGVLALYILICVSNWTITCLMNGEGRLKDILTAVGYGVTPITLSMLIATLASRFIADEEQAFYTLILAIGITYGVILMIVGIMQVHNYTLGKTILTVFLTFVALFIIVFLVLLLSNLLASVYNFFHSVYIELIFRG